MTIAEDLKYKEKLIAATRPEIIEVKNPYQDEMSTRSAEQEAAEREYQEKVKRQQAQIAEIEQQKMNIEKSRFEDMLHAKGWKHAPRPNERFYLENTVECPYGCNSQVIYRTENSPNVGKEDHDISIPLVPESTTYGNEVKRHECVTGQSKRISNLEDIVRELRNMLDVHSKDQNKHRGGFY